MMKLWIVGKVLNPEEGGDRWEFAGVFDDEKKAVAACKEKNFFVGPVELNYVVPEDIATKWPKGYYPLLEKKKE